MLRTLRRAAHPLQNSCRSAQLLPKPPCTKTHRWKESAAQATATAWQLMPLHSARVGVQRAAHPTQPAPARCVYHQRRCRQRRRRASALGVVCQLPDPNAGSRAPRHTRSTTQRAHTHTHKRTVAHVVASHRHTAQPRLFRVCGCGLSHTQATPAKPPCYTVFTSTHTHTRTHTRTRQNANAAQVEAGGVARKQLRGAPPDAMRCLALPLDADAHSHSQAA
jgi:hypothetical protein